MSCARRQRFAEGGHHVAVDGGGTDEPSLLLSLGAQRVGEMKVGAHPCHAVRKRDDGISHWLALEIAEHVVAIAHRLDRAQRAMKVRRQPVALAARRERGDDVIETQITEERGLLAGPVAGRVLRVVEEDADVI